MKTICKVAEDNCPKGLDTCCGSCEYKDTCSEACPNLSQMDKCDNHIVVNELIQFESAVPDVIEKMTELLQMKKVLDEQEKAFKQQLLEAMEKYGVKSFETDSIKMTYVAPTTRSSLDSTKLKQEHPEIVEQYSKTTNVSASVRVMVK